MAHHAHQRPTARQLNTLTLSGASLTSDTRFDHPEDAQRFGTVEHAELTKMGK